GVPVVVALVDGARMPVAGELPDNLAVLADCRAVSVAGEGDLDSLFRAVADCPAAPRRRLATRERLVAAIESASRRGRGWAVAGAIAGAAAGMMATVRTQQLLDWGVFAVGMLLIPLVGGWCAGRRLGGRIAPWLAAVSFPIVVDIQLIGLYCLASIPGI